MLSLKEFKRAELSFPKQYIVGGWSEVIQTTTGNIVHEIDCDGTETWVIHSGNSTSAGTPQGFAQKGDHG